MFSIDFPCDKFNIVVESEDAGDEQEGLGDIDQQAVRHVVNHDDLIRNQRNAAHDEQHGAGILRDFKARVFHVTEERFFFLHQRGTAIRAEDETNDVTECLKHHFRCFVHNRCVFLKCE